MRGGRLYFKQHRKKFFYVLIVYFLLSIFSISCSLLEKEEISFETEEKKNSTAKEEQERVEEEQTKEREDNTKKETSSSQTESSILYVYICGQVKNPGVYSLEAGKRVNDAVNLAGGFTKEAALESLNLARQVADGEQIYVMSKEEAATSQTIASQMPNSSESVNEGDKNSISSEETKTKVNINTASREELMTLSGIGQAKADSIIAYRQANGPFQSIEEIKLIEGIKDGIFLKIKDQITI